MTKSLYRLPIILAVLFSMTAVLSWASAKTDWDTEARSRKADYIYLESQSAYSAGDYDKYITLVERAYAIDSADLDVANEWAQLALMDESTDSAKAVTAYNYVKAFYLAHPDNYISGKIFSNIAYEQKRFDDAVMVWEMLDSIYPTRPEIAFELADAYTLSYVNGDSAAQQKAMAIYDRIEAGSGRSIGLTSKKLYLYFTDMDTLAIVGELDSLYASAPYDSYTALFIGANYRYLDMPEKTIKYFDLACQLDSTNGQAYLSRAKYYNQIGDSAAFDHEVFVALKSPNLDVTSKVDILKSYVYELYTDTTQEGRIRQLFNELQLMHAGEPEIHSLYGAYLYELADYAGAADQFSYLVALSPNDESAWTSYIQTLGLSQDTVALEKESHEAIKKFPTNLYFPIVLSNMYRINGHPQKAIEVLDSVDLSAIKNLRVLSNFLTSKGDTYATVGDTIKALEIYDQAIDYDHNNSMALNNAAYFIALSGGDLDKAERYSAMSLQNEELNPTYLDTYAWVFFMKKDYSMAKQYIDMALTAYGESGMTTDKNAEGIATVEPENVVSLADSTDVEELVEIEAETDIEAPSADIYDHAGDIYFMNGEKEQALKFWEKAHELDPDDKVIEKKVKNKTIFFR